MTAHERVVDALRAHGRNVIGGDTKAKAQCPAHDDNTPSLSVTAIDGSALIYCHAGCSTDDVLGALGLTARDLFDDPRGATYDYPDGRQVHRTPAKKFRQSGNTKGRALFHADRIGDACLVYVTEGEKDVLAIESAGGTAVCSAMGAEKAHRFDWSPLKGLDVIVVADKDGPGRGHASQVAGLLDGIATSVRIVEAAEGCKDAADHIAAGYSLLELDTETDGAQLLDELLATLKKYVIFADEHSAIGVALWIATTHALPAFECAPRLVLTSPQKRCAKTRALDIIDGTSHHPLPSINASVAAIYRSLGGKHPPTLIIDEADTLFGTKRAAEQNEDLRAVLNAGHQRNRPVLRCVGPNQTPTEFDTFAMVALAGIGKLPDTITDRAVNITMRRRAPGEAVSKFRSRRDGPILTTLRGQLAAWAGGVIEDLETAEPNMPVEDRAADTWEPLIAVADAAGGDWPKRARKACMALVGAAEETDEEQSESVTLLTDIRQVFTDWHVSFMSSTDLANALRRLEDSPWRELELTTHGIAQRLRSYGVKTRRNSAGTARGYRLEDLVDTFARYTRQEVSETSEPQAGDGFPSDTSEASDTSSVRNVRDRQTENASTWESDGLTLSDDPPPETGASPPGDPSTNGHAKQSDRDAANAAYRAGLCRDCHKAPHAAGMQRCNTCHKIYVRVQGGYE